MLFFLPWEGKEGRKERKRKKEGTKEGRKKVGRIEMKESVTQ